MKNWLLVCTLALLGACAAPQPRFDFDPKADFTRLHTFAWLARDPLYQPRAMDGPVSLLNRRRIVDTIEAALTANGYSKAPARESADFTVVYGVGTREQLSVTSYPNAMAGPWGWGWGSYYGGDVDVRSYTTGRIFIDILDGPTRQPIWHGVSHDELTQADLDMAGTRLPAAIARILAKFPPR